MSLPAPPAFDTKQILAARNAHQPRFDQASYEILWEQVAAMALEIERLGAELAKAQRS